MELLAALLIIFDLYLLQWTMDSIKYWNGPYYAALQLEKNA